MLLFGDVEAFKYLTFNKVVLTNKRHTFASYDFDKKEWARDRCSSGVILDDEMYSDISKEDLLKITNGVFLDNYEKIDSLFKNNNKSINYIMNELSIIYNDLDRNFEYVRKIHWTLCEAHDYRHAYRTLRNLLDESNVFDKDFFNKLSKWSFEETNKKYESKTIQIYDYYPGGGEIGIRPAKYLGISKDDYDVEFGRKAEIEIAMEDEDFEDYFGSVFFKYFDDNIPQNKYRIDYWYKDEKTNEIIKEYIHGYDNWGTNCLTLEQTEKMVVDVKNLKDSIQNNTSNEFYEDLIERTKNNKIYFTRPDSNIQLTDEQKENNNLIIELYERFIYRMEYMIVLSKELGYDTMLFVGP